MKLYKQEEQVKAMKELLEYYTKVLNDEYVSTGPCPLCDAIYDRFCDDCVWTIETDMDCTNFAKKHFPEVQLPENRLPGALRIEKNKDWAELRVEQLKKWIKKYEEG